MSSKDKPHVYAKHIENVNLHGYVVDGCVPFMRLYDAEEYCMEQAEPPDKDHLVYDLNEAKSLSLVLLPELRRIKDRLERERSEYSGKITVLGQKLKRFEAMHNIMGQVESECTRGEMKETLGQFLGIGRVLTLVCNRIYELESIIRTKKEG